LAGSEQLNDFPPVLPEFKTRKEWDGKDYVPEEDVKDEF